MFTIFLNLIRNLLTSLQTFTLPILSYSILQHNTIQQEEVNPAVNVWNKLLSSWCTTL